MPTRNVERAYDLNENEMKRDREYVCNATVAGAAIIGVKTSSHVASEG